MKLLIKYKIDNMIFYLFIISTNILTIFTNYKILLDKYLLVQF